MIVTDAGRGAVDAAAFCCRDGDWQGELKDL